MSARTAMPYVSSPRSVAGEIASLPQEARVAIERRISTLARVLSGAEPSSLAEGIDVVSSRVDSAETLWLAHAVLAADLPGDETIIDMLVRQRLGGTWAALAPILETVGQTERHREVEVLVGGVTCDVKGTASSTFLSGIQRVVREAVSRWVMDKDVEFVSWTKDLAGFQRISDEERMRLFPDAAASGAEGRRRTFLVPWECTHLWVEVMTELPRTGRMLAMAQYSRNEVAVLGYDCIPVTSAATVADAMTSHFVRGLAATRKADRVAMISDAATEEFNGWLQMGAGRGDAGPEVVSIPLAVSHQPCTDADLAEARTGLSVQGLPLVLVVGSHEPRKNHLAVLHAAEVLWREGLRFQLVLVGAGSWGAAEFDRTVASLLASGRPVQSLRGLPDRLLWAAYRLAHCTLFPSLNEGFGLPVAESLAVGTPVITSAFGSMRDIVAPDGEPRGGLLIDPRDDSDIADAVRRMLTDHDLHERLRLGTSEHAARTWDDFAEELWSFLVDGVRPPG